jgi:DNA-binding NarL/FixJ family response regulator
MAAPLLPTRLIILASARLYRGAWHALLVKQPGILLAGAVEHVAGVLPLMQPGHPAAVLIDIPKPQLDVARQLQAASPHGGLLFLVDTYDLADIIQLVPYSQL